MCPRLCPRHKEPAFYVIRLLAVLFLSHLCAQAFNSESGFLDGPVPAGSHSLSFHCSSPFPLCPFPRVSGVILFCTTSREPAAPSFLGLHLIRHLPPFLHTCRYLLISVLPWGWKWGLCTELASSFPVSFLPCFLARFVLRQSHSKLTRQALD